MTLTDIIESRLNDIITLIQPNMKSEFNRRNVFSYVHNLLITHYPGTFVIWFGSVPLKTYLPDGDIDICCFPPPGTVDNWFLSVKSLLEKLSTIQPDSGELMPEFPISNVTFVNADVKILKAHVGNILVDISANKAGGLASLCFLEEVDRYIGKNHLFKRSILLIKAWCMYESHILGSHNGLLSSFSVETLVLFIINAFHLTLTNPLKVLFKFLSFYASLNWEIYCMTMYGPVKTSELPLLNVVKLENYDEYLIPYSFMDNCRSRYSGNKFSECEKTSKPIFLPKHYNVMDPLYEDNNIGRSVCLSSSFRIQDAMRKGKFLLANIINSSSEITTEHVLDLINSYFKHTIRIYGDHIRPDTDKHIASLNNHVNKLKIMSGIVQQQQFLIHQQLFRNQLLQHPLPMPMHPNFLPPPHTFPYVGLVNRAVSENEPVITDPYFLSNVPNLPPQFHYAGSPLIPNGVVVEGNKVRNVSIASSTDESLFELSSDIHVSRASDDTNHSISLPLFCPSQTQPVSAPITPPLSSANGNWRRPQPKYINPSLVSGFKNNITYVMPPIHGPVFFNNCNDSLISSKSSPILPTNFYPPPVIQDPRMFLPPPHPFANVRTNRSLSFGEDHENSVSGNVHLKKRNSLEHVTNESDLFTSELNFLQKEMLSILDILPFVRQASVVVYGINKNISKSQKSKSKSMEIEVFNDSDLNSPSIMSSPIFQNGRDDIRRFNDRKGNSKDKDQNKGSGGKNKKNKKKPTKINIPNAQMNNGYKIDPASFPTLTTKSTPRNQDLSAVNSFGAHSPPHSNKSDPDQQLFVAETPKLIGHDVSWSARLKNKSIDYQKFNELSTPNNLSKSCNIESSDPSKKLNKIRPESASKKSSGQNQSKKQSNSDSVSPIIDSVIDVKSIRANISSVDILSNDVKNVKLEFSSCDNLIILPKSPEISPKNRNKKK